MVLVPPQLAVKAPQLERIGLTIRVDVCQAVREIAQSIRLEDSVWVEKVVEKAWAADLDGQLEFSLAEREVPRGMPRMNTTYWLRPLRRDWLRQIATEHHISQVRAVEALVLRVWTNYGGGGPKGYQGPDDVERLLVDIIPTESRPSAPSVSPAQCELFPSTPSPQSGTVDGAEQGGRAVDGEGVKEAPPEPR